MRWPGCRGGTSLRCSAGRRSRAATLTRLGAGGHDDTTFAAVAARAPVDTHQTGEPLHLGGIRTQGVTGDVRRSRTRRLEQLIRAPPRIATTWGSMRAGDRHLRATPHRMRRATAPGTSPQRTAVNQQVHQPFPGVPDTAENARARSPGDVPILQRPHDPASAPLSAQAVRRDTYTSGMFASCHEWAAHSKELCPLDDDRDGAPAAADVGKLTFRALPP